MKVLFLFKSANAAKLCATTFIHTQSAHLVDCHLGTHLRLRDTFIWTRCNHLMQAYLLHAVFHRRQHLRGGVAFFRREIALLGTLFSIKYIHTYTISHIHWRNNACRNLSFSYILHTYIHSYLPSYTHSITTTTKIVYNIINIYLHYYAVCVYACIHTYIHTYIQYIHTLLRIAIPHVLVVSSGLESPTAGLGDTKATPEIFSARSHWSDRGGISILEISSTHSPPFPPVRTCMTSSRELQGKLWRKIY